MRIYGWVRRTGGVSWYRIQEPLRGLAMLGHDTSFGPDLNIGEALDYDVIITSVHGEDDAAAGWELLARMPGRPLMVYDIDDDVWNFREGLHQYEYWANEDRLRNVQSGIACADIVTTPSSVLADYVSELNRNVHVLGNYVPEWLLSMAQWWASKPFTIGYQGGDTHKYDIAMVGPTLLRFLTLHRDVHMAVWGATSYDGPFPERVHTTPWQRNINEYYRNLAMHIGLAPLEYNVFNYCKSAIKAVEYAALGIPCLASAGPTYDHTVIQGDTGYLLDKPEDWYAALTSLYEDPWMRTKMGITARQYAEQWTTEKNAHKWEAVYRG
jgi:hypothetical protein